VDLKIPKLRKGSYFPGFLEPRLTAEKALAAVIQEAYIQGVSTRSVDELVKAMGMRGISKSQQARAVGADRVLVHRGLASTEREAVPSMRQDKQVPAANDATTPFGTNGTAIIAEWATTSTFGAEPRNVSTNVPYDTLAFFLVKENSLIAATCTTARVSALPKLHLNVS